MLRQFHLERQYEAVRRCTADHLGSVREACRCLSVSPSAYYKWMSGNSSQRLQENKHIASLIEKIHMDSPDKGYRRIHDDLERFHNIHSNDKRILRICRSLGIQSTIKFHPAGCTRHAKTPQHYAENILNREFHAEKPNEKWLTDVTEFKYYEGLSERYP